MRIRASTLAFCIVLACLPCLSPFIASPAGAAGKLTMAMYEQLQEGMSYNEVVKIIGWKGTEGSRVSHGGTTVVTYTWKRWNGSNLIVQFLDGKLTTKAQAGLK